MSRTHRLLAVLPVILLVFTACQNTQSSSDVQNMRMDQGKASFGAHFRQMADNALMRDMSLAEFHFVPHTDELSGAGAARLDRMVHILNAYGGTIHYMPEVTDQDLVDRRLAHVREYLELEGCDMDRVTLEVGLSGGRGTPGEDAVRVYRASASGQNEGASGGADSSTGGVSALANQGER